MTTPKKPRSRVWAWKQLYIAALMEADDDKMTARIALAERAVLKRIRELFSAPERKIDEEETVALDDARYALRALKSCLEIHGRSAIAA